jgi:glutathione S-transferase
MLLRCSLTSPFGRKVQVAARHLGLIDRIELVPADTLDPNDPLRHDNPLGKMPVMILDDGRRIYDSRVILEHLDHVDGGGRILPVDWDARLACLTLQALGDGILDASLLVLYEECRPEAERSADWLERQRGRIRRGLAALDHAPPSLTVDAGTITVACMLNQLDRRKPLEWRDRHQALLEWFFAFQEATPAFTATVTPGG